MTRIRETEETQRPLAAKNMNTTQSQNSTATAGGHTPGPWEADVKSYRLPMVINSTDKMTVANSIFGESAEIAEANARLIAQCPAMLEALRAAIAWADSVPSPYREWGFIKQARTILAALEDSK